MNFLNRFKYARDSYAVTIMIVAIALMVNFIAARHFVRIDLTKNQLYAISDASKTIMGDLDDIVNVKVFFSEKLPPNLFAVKQYVNDMLDELSSYSQGDLMVEFLNPSDPNVMNEALSLGIPQIQMNIVEKDKLEVKNGFLGIAVMYGDKKEVLPVVQHILNVEYDLIAAIKKVTASEEKVVGFLTGHDEPALDQNIELGQQGNTFSFFKKSLDKNYKVTSVDLSDNSESEEVISSSLDQDGLEGVDTLFIAGSKTSFSEDEKKAIDKFLISGGNLVVLLDAVDISGNLEASLLDLGLDDLFEHYGFGIEKKLVLDRSNETASFNQGYVNFIVPYAYWVKAVNKYFDVANPIVSKLDSVVFPWTSSLELIEKDGVNAKVLVKTTDGATTAEEPFVLDPGAIKNIQAKDQYPLVAILEGGFTSFYQDEDSSEAVIKEVVNPGRILAIGNSRFIMDRYVRMFGQNIAFAMNAVDFLTLDESLISIRSKTSFDLPIKELSIGERQIVKFIGILLMPILVIAFGIIRFIIIKRTRITL